MWPCSPVIVLKIISGYTSRNALHVLPRFMPDTSRATIRLMVLSLTASSSSQFSVLTLEQMIFFGANDACLPGSSQHVPVDQYCKMLESLCQHPSVAAHNPKIILVTPPPVNEYQLSINDALNGCTAPSRTAANTKRYADACRKVGEKLGLPVVDLWHAFMMEAGWKEGEPLEGSKETESNRILQQLLLDGRCSFTSHSANVDEAVPRPAPQS
jgi:isoamyl acetate esterase